MAGDLQATAAALAQDGHMAFVSCRADSGRIAATALSISQVNPTKEFVIVTVTIFRSWIATNSGQLTTLFGDLQP